MQFVKHDAKRIEDKDQDDDDIPAGCVFPPQYQHFRNKKVISTLNPEPRTQNL
jgi:hypothetical protein